MRNWLTNTDRTSILVLIGLMLILIGMRITTLVPDEISWDVFGYYLYLPSTFYHGDFFLNDISWVEELQRNYRISDTLYQINIGPTGKPVALFLIGMSFLYAPFFAFGHLLAWLLGYPIDGLSLPFQYALSLGFLSYTFIGLWYLRKILRHYFSDLITAVTLIILVLGTNYFHFVTLKNLETPNVLFTILSILIWHTIQWSNSQQLKDLVIIALTVSMSTLIKPSEIVCLLIPLLWNVASRHDLTQRITLFRNNLRQVYLAGLIGFLVMLPQVLYWQINTGQPIYDSYSNPGVGLDLMSPHVWEVLFSFKKGWLIYTPLMGLSLGGFYFLFRKHKKVAVPLLIYFLSTFYIISSWTEWWYGAGFSNRPLVTSYAVLALPMAAMVEVLLKRKLWMRTAVFLMIAFFVLLNQFQQWQFRHYIIDPYRMNRSYYLASFGKTYVTPHTKMLLDIDRSFSGNQQFTNPEKYTSKSIGFYNFEADDPGKNENYQIDSVSQNGYYQMDTFQRFSPSIATTFAGITEESHAWIKASVDIFIPDQYQGPEPLLVLTFQHKGENYEYKPFTVPDFPNNLGKWSTIKAMYLTPHPRNVHDVFKIYVWHRGSTPISIDNLRAFALEPKKSWQIKLLHQKSELGQGMK